MDYIISGLILIIVIYLLLHYSATQRSKKKIEQIRSDWRVPKITPFNFESISRYADIEKENEFHRLTDQTIEDIDFYKLFSFIDRTTSRVGQQFLYRKMITPASPMENKSEGLISLFSEHGDTREQVQVELLKLSSTDAYFISSLLRDDLPEKPAWFGILTIYIIIVIGLVVLSFKFPVLIIVLIIPLAVNMALYYWNKFNTFQFTRSIPQLNWLIHVAKNVIKRGGPFHDPAVAESISNLASFQQKARLIKFDSKGGIQSELSLLGFYLIELVKIFFLIEVFAFFKVTAELKNKKASIITLFDYVGNIDTSISIASLRAGTVKTCQPQFGAAKKELTVTNIYHPLISNCVKNTLTIHNRSILITGSNMSGKSTFLRTLAINSILAQTIYTCFADAYIAPIVKQFSSIRIDDDIFQGKSYYFQEVNIMASLLAEVDLPHQNLFILDEVFKGTNTIERIASAKAILSYLNRKDNIVIVSTHDIELAALLEHEYDLYHFTEEIENNELYFDHTIRKGPLRTRNAIKILELSDYPSDIIKEARRLSELLSGT